MKNPAHFWNRVSTPPASKPGGTSLKIIQASQPYLNTSQNALDLGCGSGSISNALAPSVKHLLGIDISSRMLAYARTQAREKGLTQIDYSETHLYDIGLTPASYDLVLAFNVLPYLTELDKSLNQIHQLLKPGGLFLSCTACIRDKRNLLHPLLHLLHKFGVLPPTHFFSSTSLRDRLTQAAFSIESFEQITDLPEYFIVARK
jgi:2-polyprenyl-3-methyl-5-hydroxy-6-metoxy-1,4-benzoquinol methylase